ncbi:MAG: hypothetical protein U5K56_08465 [Halioglobus sp.]|nr:hypothetical protein [Halioglobus sp.]
MHRALVRIFLRGKGRGGSDARLGIEQTGARSFDIGSAVVFVGETADIKARDDVVGEPARFELKDNIGLVEIALVHLVAGLQIPLYLGHRKVAGAPEFLRYLDARRRGDGVVVHARVTETALQVNGLVEGVLDPRRDDIHLDILEVVHMPEEVTELDFVGNFARGEAVAAALVADATDAIVVLPVTQLFGAREPLPVEGQPLVLDIVLLGVQPVHAQQGIAAETPGVGAEQAPALVVDHVAAGNVRGVAEQVDAKGAVVVDRLIDVHRGALIVLCTDTELDAIGGEPDRVFGDEVDGTAGRTAAGDRRVRPLHNFELFHVERVAEVVAHIPDAVDLDVVAGIEAANLELVTAGRIALARLQADAGNIAHGTAQ